MFLGVISQTSVMNIQIMFILIRKKEWWQTTIISQQESHYYSTDELYMYILFKKKIPEMLHLNYLFYCPVHLTSSTNTKQQ